MRRGAPASPPRDGVQQLGERLPVLVRMMFRTPAAVQALLKKRRLDKLKSEALLRDFPAQDLDDSVLHESSILYEDQTLCEHLDNGPKIPLFERRLVLTYDGFEVITPDGDRKAVPINRVVAAQAEDARKGTLALRNGIYSWQTAGAWDDSWGSTAMLSSVPTLQRPSLGECGDLEEVPASTTRTPPSSPCAHSLSIPIPSTETTNCTHLCAALSMRATSG